MKEVYFIENLEQLKVISDPFRIKILWELEESAKTGKMLADTLSLSPSKMRYHLTELEKVGLIFIEKTEIKNGILQKFFRPIAKMISLEKILPVINGSSMVTNALIENALLSFEKAELNLRKLQEGVLSPNELIQIFDTIALSEEEFQDFKRKLLELKSSYEQRKGEGKRKRYHLNITTFPKVD